MKKSDIETLIFINSIRLNGARRCFHKDGYVEMPIAEWESMRSNSDVLLEALRFIRQFTTEAAIYNFACEVLAPFEAGTYQKPESYFPSISAAIKEGN